MIWANVTKFGQNFITPQIFLGWYGCVNRKTFFKKSFPDVFGNCLNFWIYLEYNLELKFKNLKT